MVSVCGCGPVRVDPSWLPAAARVARACPPDPPLNHLVPNRAAVLSQPHRMRNTDEFGATVKQGVRVGRQSLVVHARRLTDADGVRVGFVVSKAVGNAVVRNRVKRRLRHLVAAELATTAAGSRLVVRALPAAARPDAALGDDLHRAWSKATARLAPAKSGPSPAKSGPA